MDTDDGKGGADNPAFDDIAEVAEDDDDDQGEKDKEVETVEAPKHFGKEPIEDTEDLLEYLGGWGRYQWRLLVLCTVLSAFLCYHMYTPVLMLYEPKHHCAPDPKIFLRAELNWTREDVIVLTVPPDEHGQPSKCLMYDVDYETVKFPRTEDGSLTANTSWPTTQCRHGWHYYTDGYFTTMITERDWVCGDDWKGPFSQSVFYLGAVVGTLAFGWVGDHYGRLPSLYASNLVLLVTGLVTPLCKDLVSFSVVRFLAGLGFDTCLQGFYLMAIEYVPMDKRSIIGNLALAIGFTFAGIYEPWLLKWLRDWKSLQYVVYAQVLVVLGIPWFMHESVDWLVCKGRYERCVPIVKSIAATNGKELEKKVLDSFKRLVERNAEEQKRAAEEGGPDAAPKVTDLFRTPRCRKHTILMILSWVLATTLFDCHIRILSSLDYSIYVTFTVSCALEMPADLLVIWGVEAVGRRWSGFFSFGLGGASMLLAAALLDSAAASTALTMLGRFCTTYAFNTIIQVAYETLPTPLRGQGTALARVCGHLCTFLSPYIIYLAHFDKRLPFVIIGTLSLFGALFSVNLPETTDERLPDTLQEAEDFGRGQEFTRLPFLERWKADKRKRKVRETMKSLEAVGHQISTHSLGDAAGRRRSVYVGRYQAGGEDRRDSIMLKNINTTDAILAKAMTGT